MTNPDSVSTKIQVTLIALIFGIGFTLGGAVFGILPMYKQVSSWWKASAYVPVSARVLSAELDTKYYKGSKTYRAQALFGYEYEGKKYLSSGVNQSGTSNDNIGSYQEDTYAQLSNARDSFSPVTLWVNPQQPDQALYDRSFRWIMIVFLLPFAVLFPAIGLGALWVVVRTWRNADPQSFWGKQSNPTPHTPRLINGDGGKLIGLLIGSAFVNLIVWPIAIVFLANAHTAPWWVGVIILIFISIALGILGKTVKTMLAQRRIGKPVLALYDPGTPGSTPLQGQIQFNPALGMQLDSAEMTHAVSVSVEYIRGYRRGEDTTNTTLWQGQALQTQVVRGTQSLNFKIDLPENLPVAATSIYNSSAQNYWQVVLKALGATVSFRLPERDTREADTPELSLSQSQLTENSDEEFSKTAIQIGKISKFLQQSWVFKVITYSFLAYFAWIAITEFAIPFYQYSQSKSAATPLSKTASSLADRSLLPKIHAPIQLDSFMGNGFGVVAKVTGTMEIDDNTLLINPETIELRSYAGCEPNCAFIHTVKFSLSKDGDTHFSIISAGAPIPVLEKMPEVLGLPVSIPAYQLPIRLNFTDRQQLAGLRLTLEINGEMKAEGKYTQASWYTHSEPLAIAMGEKPAQLELADNAGQRQTQAQQAVLAGHSADLQQLIAAGIDVNARDADGQTMLMRAANRGDLDSVKMLLSHGAQVNAKTPIDKDGNGEITALHAALRQDAVEVVDALFKAGADPQAVANQAWTPVHYAAYLGAEKSIRYLHDHNVNIDMPAPSAWKSTPLMIAAQYEQVPVIKVLLAFGADPKHKDFYNENACSYARFYKKAASVEALGCR